MSVYSIPERVMRTNVFQLGVATSTFERWIIWLYNVLAGRTINPDVFHAVRAEKALESLVGIGGEIGTIIPKDELAEIQYLSISSQDLEAKINGFGARWEKVGTVLAIIPPDTESNEWLKFKEDLLKLKWNERVVEGKKVIVTCEEGDLVDESQWHKHLMIHSNSASVSFVMLKRRIGFYLGAKQNVFFYDPRGTWKSKGIASEGGYYNDIEAVYNTAKKDFDPKNIWVTTACGGWQAAGYLKTLVHETGVNFIFENGSANVKAFAPNHWLINYMVDTFWNTSLSAKDIPSNLKPKEVGFNLHELWKDLQQTDLGKIIIINPEKDNLLPDHVSASNVTLAKKINALVEHITFPSLEAQSHSDRYYTHPEPRREMMEHVFQKTTLEK